MQIRTNFTDAIVDALLEVNERVSAPEVLTNFVSSYHFAGAFQQEGQNLGGLMFQAEAYTMPRQCPVRAELIVSERQHFPWLGSTRQSTPHLGQCIKGRFAHSSAELSGPQ
jgi:hypothetical protein